MKEQNSPLYIAYFTRNTLYEEEIKSLKASLELFKLPFEIQSIESLGSWQKNTMFKAIFIQNMQQKHPKRPLVYVDADAVIRKNPLFFNSLTCDIAIHYHSNKKHNYKELLSGTLYLGATENAKKLVELWRYVNVEYPQQWEQKNLSLAIMAMKDLNLVELPPSYCQVFDLMKHEGEPVIEHFQASRRCNYK